MENSKTKLPTLEEILKHDIKCLKAGISWLQGGLKTLEKGSVVSQINQRKIDDMKVELSETTKALNSILGLKMTDPEKEVFEPIKTDKIKR